MSLLSRAVFSYRNWKIESLFAKFKILYDDLRQDKLDRDDRSKAHYTDFSLEKLSEQMGRIEKKIERLCDSRHGARRNPIVEYRRNHPWPQARMTTTVSMSTSGQSYDPMGYWYNR
jgi:hypothetical protein